MITNPALNDKINKMIALAPVSTLAHLRSPVAYLSPFESQIQVGLTFCHQIEFNQNKKYQ